MAGRLDGSREKAKMDPSAMRVVIGKHERRENGMNARIYLVNSVKLLLVPLKDRDFKELKHENKKPRGLIQSKLCT